MIASVTSIPGSSRLCTAAGEGDGHAAQVPAGHQVPCQLLPLSGLVRKWPLAFCPPDTEMQLN